jgi:capsular exopolysaccharide synthesis family protein
MSSLSELSEMHEVPQKSESRVLIPNSPEEAPVELRSSRSYPLIVDPDQSLAAEHFGVLRARLLSARAKSGIRSVVISSAQKQEGKSLTCLNLAISLAQLGKDRILLVDGDLRRAGVTRLLSLDGRTGLADFLHNRERFDICVKRTTLPYLSVAPCGKVSEQSLPGILEGTRWAEFLQAAKTDFDLIIVDSVPVSVPIADFELLLAACDAALLVVRLRKTARQNLEATAEQLNGKLLGIIVNNAEPLAGFSDYSYYQENQSRQESPGRRK